MSSKFVSGGLINPSNGDTVEPPAPSEGDTQNQLRHKAEWDAVERELEKERSKRAEARRAAATSAGEKSLYEVLQANKAAKQAAFEEANRLKNQFRALDEDEVDFLESMMASSRAEEDRVRQETLEGIAKFRQEQQKQEKEHDSGSSGTGGKELEKGRHKVDDDGSNVQESLKKSGLVDDADLEEGGWQAGGRKRKRREGKPALLFKGLKKRASGLLSEAEAETESKKDPERHKTDTDAVSTETDKPEAAKKGIAASNTIAMVTAEGEETAAPRAENIPSSKGKSVIVIAAKKNAGENAKRRGLVDYDSGSDSSD